MHEQNLRSGNQDDQQQMAEPSTIMNEEDAEEGEVDDTEWLGEEAKQEEEYKHGQVVLTMDQSDK